MARLRNTLLLLTVLSAGCGKSGANRIAQAQQLEKDGKTAEARLLYGKALQADPNAYEADYRLGLLDQKTASPLPALAHFEKAAESGEVPHLAAFSRLGLQIYLEHPEQKALFAKLQRVSKQLEAKPGGEVEAWRTEGYLAVMQKRSEEAIANFTRVLDRDQDNRHADVQLALLQQLLGSGKRDEANLLADKLVPGSPIAETLLDTLYLHRLAHSGCREARAVLERKAALAKDKLSKDNGVTRLQLAVHERRCHGAKAEAAELAAYLEQSGNRREAEIGVGDYHAEQGNWALALASFERAAALPRAASQVELEKRLSSALMGLGRVEEAARTLDRLIQNEPNDAAAKAQRGLLRMFGDLPAKNRAADFQLGLQEVREALAQTASPVPPQIRLQLVLGLMRNAQLPEARVELQKILAAAPDALSPRLVLAQLELREGKAEAARKLCEQILLDSPGQREARLIRALSLKTLNATAEAKAELRTLAAQYPNDQNIAVQYLALLAAQPGAKTDMLLRQGLDRLARSNERKSDMLFPLAEIHWQLGEAERSDRIFQEIYDRGGDPRALLRQSELRMSGGGMERGCASLQSIAGIGADLRKNLQASWWGLTAVCRESQKNLAGALEAHRKALEIQPKNAVLNNNLAAFLAEQKQDLDQALQLAKTALAASPNEPEFLDTLGWIYFQKKDLENSKRIYLDLSKRANLSTSIHSHQQTVLAAAKY